MITTTTRLLCLAAAAMVLGGCGSKDAASAEKKAAQVIPVVTARASQQSLPLIVSSIGNVEALASVAVKSLVDGQIVQVHVRDGQEVARGQALFQVDPRPFELQLSQAQASEARDQAALATSQAQFARYEELLKQGYVSKDQYAQVKLGVDSAHAALAADSSAITRAKLSLEYADIRAPIAGRLGKIALKEGNLVKANDTNPLVTLNQIDPVGVGFTVTEHDFGAIRSAMAGHGLPVTARDDASGAQFQGELTFVDNNVDTATGTVRLRASFANPKGELWPGQFVGVTLKLRDEQVLAVPSTALQTGPKGSYVFVVKDDGSAELRDVKVRRSDAQLAVIDSGLADGERVVTDGQSRLTPGAHVSERAPGNAAAGGS